MRHPASPTPFRVRAEDERVRLARNSGSVRGLTNGRKRAEPEFEEE
jgi:hypothetical protein